MVQNLARAIFKQLSCIIDYLLMHNYFKEKQFDFVKCLNPFDPI
jgi:hypothetical protein